MKLHSLSIFKQFLEFHFSNLFSLETDYLSSSQNLISAANMIISLSLTHEMANFEFFLIKGLSVADREMERFFIIETKIDPWRATWLTE
jgi:hypothetical protein